MVSVEIHEATDQDLPSILSLYAQPDMDNGKVLSLGQAHEILGIGKQMMLFAIDRCREKGCYKVALSSSMKRKMAHRFYESLGFQKHGYSFVVGILSSEGTISVDRI